MIEQNLQGVIKSANVEFAVWAIVLSHDFEDEKYQTKGQ